MIYKNKKKSENLTNQNYKSPKINIRSIIRTLINYVNYRIYKLNDSVNSFFKAISFKGVV